MFTSTLIPVSFQSKEDEIKHINDQLYQYEVQIQRIITCRTSLLHKLNNLQSSDNIFPNEIMSAIFEQACLPDTQDDKPASRLLVLGAVCSRWRQIIWNEPSFWTSVGPIPPHRPIRPYDVVQLQLHLQNAKTQPISLDLRLDCLPPKHPNTRDLLRVVFVENSARIRSLTFSPTNSGKIRSMIFDAINHSHLPNLSTISFAARKTPSFSSLHKILPSLFNTAAHIQTLSFNGYALPDSNGSFWGHITVLQLTNIPLDQCMRALRWCSNLVEYHSSQPKLAEAGVRLVAGPPAILVNLEVFDVHGYLSHRWRSYLFTYFRFPNLKYFGWDSRQSLAEGIPSDLLRLFFGAMKSLTKLRYSGSLYGQFGLQDILQHMGSSIQIIHIPYPPCDWSLILTALVLLKGSPGTLKTLELRLPHNYMMFDPEPQRQASEVLREVGLDLKMTAVYERPRDL